MKLKPLFDRVILLPEKADTVVGGIILPPVSEQKSQIATVISVGDGGCIDGKDVKMYVKPGNRVLYSQFAGSEFKSEGTTYLIIKQTDILAVIEE